MFDIVLDWSKKYGDLFTMKLGAVRIIWICRLELAREMLLNRGIKFDSRPNWTTLIKETRQNEGVLFNSGETYRQLRSLLESVANGEDKGVKRLENLIVDEATQLSKQIQSVADEGKDVDLSALVRAAFMNLLYSIIFGQRHAGCCLSSSSTSWSQLISEIKALRRIFTVRDFIPCMSNLSILSSNSLLKEKLRKVRKIIRDEILKHRNFMNIHGSTDLIDLYNEAKRKGTDISENNLLCLILDCFTADTSAETFLWIIAFIVSHEKVQDKCRDEISKVIGSNTSVKSEDTDRLPYTTATVYEVLRLKGKQFTYPHATFRDIKLGEYVIPRQSIMIVNLASIHRDPKLWNSPLEFCPERFLDSSGKLKHIDHFYPYGIGNRKCTMQQKSETTLLLFFANIIRQFKFIKSSAGEPVDLTDYQESFLSPVIPKPFRIKVTKVFQ